MFGIGGFELFLILIIAFLILGPEKLPDAAKTVGKGIARFRNAQQEMNEALGDEKIFDPNNPDEPFKDPVEALDRIAKRQEEKRAKKSNGQSSSEQKADSAKPAQPEKKSEPEKAIQSENTVQPETAAEPEKPAQPEEAHRPEGQGQPEEPRQESFTERKARYERERAARKAAEKAGADGTTTGPEPAPGQAATERAAAGSEPTPGQAANERAAADDAAPAQGGEQ